MTQYERDCAIQVRLLLRLSTEMLGQSCTLGRHALPDSILDKVADLEELLSQQVQRVSNVLKEDSQGG